MNTFSLHIVLCVIMLIGIAACSETTETVEREPPKTPSEVLNEIVRSVPYHYIDLDDLSSQEIILNEDDMIYDVNRHINEDELLIGRITQFTYANNSFYVYDGMSNAIFRLDRRNGNVEGPLTRDGQGPGEHQYIHSLESNSRYIFASDLNNARINQYTNKMEPLDPLGNFRSQWLEINDELILSHNQKSAGFVPENPDEGVVVISTIDQPDDTLTTIMPRIIPEGYQPEGYNNPWFSINQSNTIVASYLFLPWLFIYDNDFNHSQTLILEYSIFEEMDIPDMEIFKPRGNEGFGGSTPFNQFKIMDNGDIFITLTSRFVMSDFEISGIGNMQTATEWVLIHLSEEDGVYKAKGKYVLKHPLEDTTLNILDIYQSENPNEYYIGNWENIFRFTIPE